MFLKGMVLSILPSHPPLSNPLYLPFLPSFFRPPQALLYLGRAWGVAKANSGTQVIPDASGRIGWSGLSNSAGQPGSGVSSSVLSGSGSQGLVNGANSPNSFGLPTAPGTTFGGVQI